MRTATSECRLQQQCEAMFILSYLILYIIWYYCICIISRSSRAEVFLKKCFKKFWKIQQKTHVLESLFLRTANNFYIETQLK